jgi:hypothetical protein
MLYICFWHAACIDDGMTPKLTPPDSRARQLCAGLHGWATDPAGTLEKDERHMAHNLATINVQDAIAYIDDTPWHGLGVRKDLRATPKERMISSMIEAAQLGFQVGSLPLYLADGTEVKGHKASVRFADDGSTAATLGIVGDGYRHVQNAEACEILQVLAQEFGCVPSAAGALGNGEKCWMLMRLADATITPVPGDDVRGYFLLHWGHDGNISIQGLGTGIRWLPEYAEWPRPAARRGYHPPHRIRARVDAAAKLIRA